MVSEVITDKNRRKLTICPSCASKLKSPDSLTLKLDLENDKTTADQKSRGGQEWQDDGESSVKSKRSTLRGPDGTKPP